MIRGPHRILAVLVALIVCGWLLIALVPHPRGPDSILGTLTIAAMLGTMFGQVSLAAAWCALGPFALIQRLPLSFAWIAAIVLSFGCNIARDSNSGGLAVLILYAIAFVGQWLLVQMPIWLLTARYGLRIVGANYQPANRELRDQQYGIRQVMILTALVAVVLGAGRTLLGGLRSDQPFLDWKVIMFFGFFALANATIAFPLIDVALTGRNLPQAIVGALSLVAAATLVELLLFPWLSPFGTSGAEGILVAMNAVQCLWILTVLFLLRAAGFRLESRHAAVPASSEN